MTRKQRRLVWSWVAVGAVLSISLLFYEVIEAKAPWLIWIVILLSSIAAAKWDLGKFAAMREDAPDFLEGERWIKVWVIICAVAFFGGAIYLTRAGISIVDVLGFKVLVVALVVLIAPVVIESQRQRYKEYGEDPNAI